MKYFIGKNDSDKSSFKITSQEFDSLRRAQSILVSARAIEEKYDILIYNYKCLEDYILIKTNEFLLHKGLNYIDFFDLRHKFNIQVVNLLTSARLYLDQVGRDVKKSIPERKDFEETFKSITAKEYDSNRDYRFMEALRNYVQHCGLPVHLTNHNLSRRQSKQDDFFEFILRFYTRNSILREDRKFKKVALDEFKENIDLTDSIRGYLESISKIHESLRCLIKESVYKSRVEIENFHRRYIKSDKGRLSSLSAYKMNEHGDVEYIPLLLDWDDNRVNLIRRNGVLTNLKRRFVSNRISGK